MSLFAFPEIAIGVITLCETLYTWKQKSHENGKGLEAFITGGGHSGGSGEAHFQACLKAGFLPVKMSVLTMQTFRVPISGGMLQTDNLVSYLQLGPLTPYIHLASTFTW